SLMRCGNRRNRFTRPELSTQLLLLFGTPRKAMPERRPTGIVPRPLSLLLVRRRSVSIFRTSFGMFVRPLGRNRSQLLWQRAFDQSLPLAIGQQRQAFVGAVCPRIGPDAMAPLLPGQLIKKLRRPGCLPETHIREGEADKPLRPRNADIGHPAFLFQVV